MGNALRIYELGKKKLLRKCETRQFPNRIVEIQTVKDRIIVSDIQEGPFFCKYISAENRIVCVADSSIARWMTCFTVLDYDTIIGGDKFGNVFVVRVPPNVSEESQDAANGGGGAVKVCIQFSNHS
jgi:splicing factor 3B subunit 3